MAKKLYYKIGEACKSLDIQPYVLRYWETEFPALKPNKSKSGQRVYSEQDLVVIRRIKELLYDEGYTIAGAKKKLEKEDLSALGEVRVPEKPASARPEPVVPEEAEAAKEEPPKRKAEAPEAPTPKRGAKKKARAKKKAPAGRPSASEARLRRGVREALKEARAILEILDTD